SESRAFEAERIQCLSAALRRVGELRQQLAHERQEHEATRSRVAKANTDGYTDGYREGVEKGEQTKAELGRLMAALGTFEKRFRCPECGRETTPAHSLWRCH